MDAGGCINGYKKRTCENIISLLKTFELEGCLAFLKITRFDTLKKQGWGETNKLAVRYVLRSWEAIIWKAIRKKHADLSSQDPEQICKSILEDVINDI